MVFQVVPDATGETVHLFPNCDVLPEIFALRKVTVVNECT